MNNLDLQSILGEYPVRICSADNIEKDKFVIANTDSKDGPGKHWVAFFFTDSGPDEFFDSLGKPAEFYDFEEELHKPYLTNCNRLQEFGSNACGYYCVYFVMCRYAGMALSDIIKVFNVRDLSANDRFVRTFVNITQQKL